MVREIKFSTRDRFIDAAEVLIKHGGLFNMLPGRVLAVSEEHFAALIEAGLVTKNGTESRASGKRKTESRKKPGRVAG
jgi:hypothetical protein